MSQNPRTGRNREERHADQPGRSRGTDTGQYEPNAGRRSTDRRSEHGSTGQQGGRSQRRYGQDPSQYAGTQRGQRTGQSTVERGQQVRQGQRQGRRSQQGQQGQRSPVERGLEFGGEARHDHEDTHVGAERTYGESDRGYRQQASGSSNPEEWQEDFREYPTGPEGHEQYGHGHRHGDESGRSQGGRRYDSSRR